MWTQFVMLLCYAGSITFVQSLKCSRESYFELTKENINESVEHFDKFPSYSFWGGQSTTRNKHREPCKIPKDNCARFVFEDPDCKAIENCFKSEMNVTVYVKTTTWPGMLKAFSLCFLRYYRFKTMSKL